MTLAELANYVCRKVHLSSDADAVEFAKDAARMHYERIWNSALWTETLVVLEHTVAAGDSVISISDNPTVYYFPRSTTTAGSAPRLNFVVAARWTEAGSTSGTEIINGNWAEFFRVDPTAWNSDRAGTPANFINIPKDANGYCRIKLVPTVAKPGTVYILGKIKLENLTNDTDTATIPGAEAALINYIEAEMLEYLRDYQKAAAKEQSGDKNMQIPRDMERNQQQSLNRIIPGDDGYSTAADLI